MCARPQEVCLRESAARDSWGAQNDGYRTVGRRPGIGSRVVVLVQPLLLSMASRVAVVLVAATSVHGFRLRWIGTGHICTRLLRPVRLLEHNNSRQPDGLWNHGAMSWSTTRTSTQHQYDTRTIHNTRNNAHIQIPAEMMDETQFLCRCVSCCVTYASTKDVLCIRKEHQTEQPRANCERCSQESEAADNNSSKPQPNRSDHSDMVHQGLPMWHVRLMTVMMGRLSTEISR